VVDDVLVGGARGSVGGGGWGVGGGGWGVGGGGWGVGGGGWGVDVENTQQARPRAPCLTDIAAAAAPAATARSAARRNPSRRAGYGCATA
jgi:hypothetical protein